MAKIKEITLTIDGNTISVPHKMTAIQAVWHGGKPLIHGVGCLEGVCGACKIVVRRKDDLQVTTELGCQTLVEDGMDVIFLKHPTPNHHSYVLSDFENSWDMETRFHSIFPEARDCRHCGGCNNACPKGIEVEKVVNLSAEGKFKEAGALFFECVMCGLCISSCPERITPNHVGLFARRIDAFFHIRPSNLINRLLEIEEGKHKIEIKD